jgi:hypothetical protein
VPTQYDVEHALDERVSGVADPEVHIDCGGPWPYVLRYLRCEGPAQPDNLVSALG